MATELGLVEVAAGIGLLTLTYGAFLRLRPRNGVVHPWATRDVLGTLIILGLVASLALGTAFLIRGLVALIAGV